MDNLFADFSPGGMTIKEMTRFKCKYEAKLAGKSIDRFGITCPLRHIRSSVKHVKYGSMNFWEAFERFLCEIFEMI